MFIQDGATYLSVRETSLVEHVLKLCFNDIYVLNLNIRHYILKPWTFSITQKEVKNSNFSI